MKTASAFHSITLFLISSIFPLGILADLAEDTRRPNVVFVSGEFEYESSKTLPTFIAELNRNYPLDCVYLEREKGESIPGIEALKNADLAVVFIRRMTLPEEQLGYFKSHVESGKPLIGIRTSSHAFENWKSFDADVLGGNYHNHHGNKLETSVSIKDSQATHSILSGLAPFVSDGSLYKNAPIQEDTQILLEGTATGHPAEPVAWTRTSNNRRVFYTSLGHPNDFKESAFKSLLINSIYWALDDGPTPAPVEKGPARRVGVAEFDQLRVANRPTIIDIRTPEEFNAGRLPGAINVNFFAPNFNAQIAKLDRDQTYLIHCASGGRSGRACGVFNQLGFSRIIELQPGFKGWARAGKPFDR
jgi:rhodanese-related sulfurtransferase/type 1 glutamine amidotransferase